jgi:hypothetical protein
MVLDNLKERWERVYKEICDRFADGDEMELTGIVFLIGLQELQKGYREYKKDEKLEIIHIGVCSLLTRYGYYKYVGRDEDGWPHFEATEMLPNLSAGQQTILLKESIVLYFEGA